MSETFSPFSEIRAASGRMAKRALDAGENRLQLLLLEVEEERERLLMALLMALCMATFALLAGVALTIVVLLVFWNTAPLVAMIVLTAVYAGMALFFYARLARLRREWEAFAETLAQLRKDREWLAELLR
ncbi:MAG TPA: phage holin family protein [Verrucomicrobiae bacterium]|jgi:uncharacterized membrane protein YqjE